MDIGRTIKERRTVHCYLNEEVSQELIYEALELATYAPNHKLTFPFLFILLGPQSRKKIAALAFELKGQKEAVRDQFLKEGSLIFFAQKIAEDDFTRREDYATLACGIQNFSLFMWEKGIGTKWSTGAVTRSAETYAALELDPSEYEIVGMVWAGQVRSAPRPKERPHIKDFIKQTD